MRSLFAPVAALILARAATAAPMPKAEGAKKAGKAARPRLSKDAEAFVRAQGVDLESADFKRAVSDGVIKTDYDGDPEEFSLERLAKAKKKNAVANFIGTRAFIAKLKADYAGTPIPTENYDPLYLTHDERDLVGRKFAERFKK
jgi:hypothetical protein